MARAINARRTPTWPSPLTGLVPRKEIADNLIAYYFSSTDAIYRILHIPTFYRDYEALWVMGATRNTSFLVLFKLVMAIGAIVYDRRFTLRVSAIRWVYEAQTWVAQPKFKSRLDLQSLQIDILLLIAQERLGIGESMGISVGALVRKAICMGLHKDPTHTPLARTVLVAEMRRRLWNTILELSLLSSLTSGGPPLISLDDFDTAPPGNFNDNQLTAGNPIPKPEDYYTGTSVAIWLRRTFPIRLAVVKHLNGLALSQTTYRETMLLDAELRTAFKEIDEAVQACRGPDRPVVPSPPEIRAMDFLEQQITLSLHAPYFGPSLKEAAYAFSRQAVVDSSFKLFRTAWPRVTLSGDHDGDIPRLCHSSSGFYSTATFEAAVMIAVELRAQLHGDTLGPVSMRSDLLSVLDDEAPIWACMRSLAGETNVKGYLLLTFLSVQIAAPLLSRNEEILANAQEQITKEAEETCVDVLQRMLYRLDQKREPELEYFGTLVEGGEEDFEVSLSPLGSAV